MDTYEEESNVFLEDAFDEVDELGRYFFYEGSMTTPPCTENVKWVIWKDIQGTREKEIDFFKDNTPLGNNKRNTQQINSRVINYYQGVDGGRSFAASVSVCFSLMLALLV